MTGLFGGAFDPPHNGHVALAEAAARHFEPGALVVLVAASPGHRAVVLDGETRARLTRAAFPEQTVVLDPHPRTIDMLREGRWADPLFLIGADQFASFPSWKEPGAVLEHARLGVATRPGYPRDRLDGVLDALARPDRVEFFDIPAVDVSSSEVRRLAALGQPVGGLVPPAVARLIAELGLYRSEG